MWYRTAKINIEFVSTCIIIRKNNDTIEVLLVKRASKPNKNKWCVPGGHIEDDEQPVEAAIREIKEETDINLNKNNLFLVDEISSDKLNNYIYATIQTKYNKEKSGSDAKDAKWFKVSELPDLIWNNNFYIDKALNLLNKNL